MVIVSFANKCENGGTEQQDVHPICQCPHGFKGFNCSQRGIVICFYKIKVQIGWMT